MGSLIGTISDVEYKAERWQIHFAAKADGGNNPLVLNLDNKSMTKLFNNHELEMDVFENFIAKNGESVIVYGKGKTLAISIGNPKGTIISSKALQNVVITIYFD
jgi:hypothetical protein